MITKKSYDTVGNLFQFSPYIFFILTYYILYFYTLYGKNIACSSNLMLNGLALCSLFITIIYAFFTFKKKKSINKKIEIFLSGAGNSIAMYSYFTLIFTALFNYMLAKTNGILTIITLGIIYIPASWMILTAFLVTSMYAICIPSFSTAIIIIMPIACGIAQSLKINPAYMAATVISGGLFGTHILEYIAANKKLKPLTFRILFKTTSWYIIPAAIISLIILFQYNHETIHPEIYIYLQESLDTHTYITIAPYCFLLCARLLQFNMLLNLIIASCIALIIEVFYHNVMFINAFTAMFHGFYDDNLIVSIVLAQIMLAGLINIIKYNGGFNYITEKLLAKGKQSDASAQFFIIITTIIINILATIAPTARHITAYTIQKFTDTCSLPKNLVINFIQITTTTTQTMLPYSPIMLLAISISKSSYFEIIFYMFYPITTAIFMMLSIIFSHINRKCR